MIEIHWSKAPEGATHYGPETEGLVAAWYKPGPDGDWLCALDKSDSWDWVLFQPDNLIPVPEGQS